MRVLLSALLLLVCAPLSAQESDATSVLNSLLIKKPSIAIAKTCKRTISRCHYSKAADGEVCFDVEQEYSCQEQIAPQVTSAAVILVKNIRYDKPDLTSVPEKAFLTRKVIANCATNATLSSSVNFSITGNKSTTVAKTEGVTTSNGGNFNLSGAIPGVGTAGLGLTWNTTVNTSTVTTESQSESIVRTVNESVTVPARQAINFEALVYESGATIPFTASAVVDGPVRQNVSGIGFAHDLLTEAERTVNIRGTVKVTGVSEAYIRTENIGAQQPEACKSGENTVTSENFILSAPSKSLINTFTVPAKALRSNNSIVARARSAKGRLWRVSWDAGSTIGPPDGTICEIVSSSTVYKPTPLCGFNDAGAPVQGLFDVQDQICRTYANGQFVNQEAKSQETFTGQCWSP